MGLKENIKMKRLENKMTMEELAKKIGTSKPTIQRYESGKITNIPSDKIEAMARALNTTPEFLMGWKTRESTTVTDNDVKVALFGGDKEVSEELWDEVMKYAEYLKEKYKKD